MTHRVTLDVWELEWAARLGTLRDTRAQTNKFKEYRRMFGVPSTPEESLRWHILGVCGELCFCKWANIYPDPGRNTFRGADFGARIQVKTRSLPTHDLLISLDEPRESEMVLVRPVRAWTGDISAPVTFELPGWFYAWEAFEPHRDFVRLGSAVAVPATVLHPLCERFLEGLKEAAA